MADAHGAALDVLAAALGHARPQPDPTLPTPMWGGAYAEPETRLSARIELAGPGQLRLRFGQAPEVLALRPDGSAGNGRTELRRVPEGVLMRRPQDNMTTILQPAALDADFDIGGLYRCAELDATLTVVDAGGALYGGFAGFLGQGRMEPLMPVAPDLWALPCPRALDHAPPGDWTLAIRRDEAGRAVAVEVGCWLARGLLYARAA